MAAGGDSQLPALIQALQFTLKPEKESRLEGMWTANCVPIVNVVSFFFSMFLGERFLKQIERTPGFGLGLVQLIDSNNENIQGVRLSAAVTLKNYVKKYWPVSEVKQSINQSSEGLKLEFCFNRFNGSINGWRAEYCITSDWRQSINQTKAQSWNKITFQLNLSVIYFYILTFFRVYPKGFILFCSLPNQRKISKCRSRIGSRWSRRWSRWCSVVPP